MYPEGRPAKHKRATPQGDAPRDNWMGWRRISVRGGSRVSPPALPKISRAIPRCLVNCGGAGAEPPTPNGWQEGWP